jgi:8-oxo-dGTP pyrophosphatase MutT (NUDIX family)
MLLMTTGDDLQRTRDQVARVIADAVSQAEAVEDNAIAYQQASWLADELAAGVSATGRLRARIARRWRDAEGLSVGELARLLGLSRGRAGDMLRDRDAVRKPEPPPVVAAIVTSQLGVLASRRNDGKPPWGFISGQIEPGESAADAAVREVKEETGLQIIAGREIGRRVHPATGRTIVYLSGRPDAEADSSAVHVGDENELAEVRWLSVDEITERMPDLFAPVRAYLARDGRRQALRP